MVMSLYRNPRSQQERRANGNPDLRRIEIMVGGQPIEVRILVRGRRNAKKLPEAWRDLPPGRQRSWK
jgi:hypothetical protein